MRHDSADLRGFNVIDEATGQKLVHILWVDDVALEYGTISHPARFEIVDGLMQLAADVTKVTRVVIDYVRMVVLLNEPPRVIQGVQCRVERPCDECTDAGRCSRIGQCLRFKCGFGEVCKP